MTTTSRPLFLDEVARRLGVCYWTARNFTVSGKLPSLRLAGRRRIQVLESDLEAFIQASRRGHNVGPIEDSEPSKHGQNESGPIEKIVAGKPYPKDWHERVTAKRTV